MTENKDHWSAEVRLFFATTSNHLLTLERTTLAPPTSYTIPKSLKRFSNTSNPQPTDHILDVGCGDAKFTANYLEQVAEVYGVDASPSFIKSANEDYAQVGKARFKLVDCRYLERDAEAVSGKWDKVVSNAALHWILRDESTRINTLKACHDALKPGGRFVFEMGGAGNVSEVHTALLSALMHQGMSAEQARKADTWFFPSDKWMRSALEGVGFEVEKLEMESRPTPCTSEKEGGLEGWVRLMGGQIIRTLQDREKEEAVVKEVLEVLETVVRREEDGSQWLGYVRLRGVATKPRN